MPQQPLRLRLVHQLSLLLVGAVVVALASVGGVVAWNLRSGFGEYLRARDDVQLDRFVQLLELRSAPDPSMGWLRGSREAMQLLVEEFASVEGLERPAPRRPRGEGPPPGAPFQRPGEGPPQWPGEGPGERPPGERFGEWPGGPGAPPPPPPPRREGDVGPGPPPPRPYPPPVRTAPQDGSAPAPAGNIAGRIQIFDVQGQWLAGREQPRGEPTVSRAVVVRGQQVATVRLTREPEPQGVDARFLQRQYGGLGAAIAATLLLSLLLAWWAARRWSRPLRNLQQATRRMAQGELGHQVPLLGEQEGTQEIAALIDDVNSMSQALAQLEAARRVWIAQISHELRTPLAVLRGEIESIEDGARQPTPEVMANLRDEVLQLTRLVNDLHTLSMADLGQLPCVFVSGDASAALLRVATRFAPRAAQRGLQLETQPAPAITVCWDFGRIEQLLTNLLENSLRYTTAPGRVSLAWQQVGDQLRLTVEDTPPGVAPAQLPQLFEPLFRADTARGRSQTPPGGEVHGSGLGLSIAQAIVQAHQGRIRASASALGGLAIEVTLPLQAG